MRGGWLWAAVALGARANQAAHFGYLAAPALKSKPGPGWCSAVSFRAAPPYFGGPTPPAAHTHTWEGRGRGGLSAARRAWCRDGDNRGPWESVQQRPTARNGKRTATGRGTRREPVAPTHPPHAGCAPIHCQYKFPARPALPWPGALCVMTKSTSRCRRGSVPPPTEKKGARAYRSRGGYHRTTIPLRLTDHQATPRHSPRVWRHVLAPRTWPHLVSRGVVDRKTDNGRAVTPGAGTVSAHRRDDAPAQVCAANSARVPHTAARARRVP